MGLSSSVYSLSPAVPSIELISIEQEVPSTLPEFPFAVRAEPMLLSHREPSLFQRDFDQLRGCIYHLGSPFCDDTDYDGPFFAYELLSERCRVPIPARFLEFDASFLVPLFDLIGLLLDASPAHLLVLTTDWQCGPRPARRYRPITERTFWQRHADRRLRLNALYPIRKNRTACVRT